MLKAASWIGWLGSMDEGAGRARYPSFTTSSSSRTLSTISVGSLSRLGRDGPVEHLLLDISVCGDVSMV